MLTYLYIGIIKVNVTEKKANWQSKVLIKFLNYIFQQKKPNSDDEFISSWHHPSWQPQPFQQT